MSNVQKGQDPDWDQKNCILCGKSDTDPRHPEKQAHKTHSHDSLA